MNVMETLRSLLILTISKVRLIDKESEKSMAKGGARPGAGRPKGSHQNPFRAAFKEAFDEEKLKVLFDKAYSKAKAGDTKMISYIFDQLMGRATQPVDMDAKMELLEYVIKRGDKTDTRGVSSTDETTTGV